jgi:glyoxylase-like metal-dependent hydrolase (beta-lactamase superfamily II)
MLKKIMLCLPFLTFFSAVIAETSSAAQLELVQVSPDSYAIVGDMGNRSPTNLGNNATFGFVITTEGIVLIDAGGTYQGAEQIHNVIKQVSNKPVTYVINSGGQDHRWLGNGYFKQRGAKIIASAAAVKDQKARVKDQFFMLNNLVGLEGVNGTEAVFADETFDHNFQLQVGNIRFEIYHSSPAHTAGDSFVLIPDQKIIFAGDIVFTERLLGILDHSSSKGWMKAFEQITTFNPKIIVPGHGHPTTLDKARSDTYDYIKFLREEVAQFMGDGGDIADISSIDQSSYSSLISFDALAGRNAQQIYSELEWE